MRLKISHRTEYRYDAPVYYALQRLRLTPLSGSTQQVRDWKLDISGAEDEVRFIDQFGNDTRLVSFDTHSETISIVAAGEVDTNDNGGVVGRHRGFAPLWLFLRETPLTACGDNVRALVETLPGGAEIERLHALMLAVAGKVAYTPGATASHTTAENALALGAGVCQDHAHIFASAARLMGHPARYVSGYLMMDGVERQVASHAWAEAHVDALGWVAFDAANGISPDARYVTLARGLDYRDAAPVSGIRYGAAEEALAVDITVEQ
ncbi:MAG: transglutaminase family protein [Rhizobiaceae bacterium]|nr:transglutaminase family protein [Rhizobiaceae bacterium]MCV0409100.1 transglutaminase family protein [Rhizobiaceae bacterium]